MTRRPTFSPADSPTVGTQIHRTQARAALLRWQVEYATWLAQQGKRPKRAERLLVASTLRNKHRDRETQPEELAPLTLSKLRWLEGHEEFHRLVDSLIQGGIEAAQKYLRALYPTLASLHVWAAEHAREKGDHRAMAALTTPAMDRFEPKRSEAPTIPAVVVINLTPEQHASFTAPPATFEAESVPLLPPPGEPE